MAQRRTSVRTKSAAKKPASSSRGTVKKRSSSKSRPTVKKQGADSRAALKAAQNKVFPVVIRIKEEIDFCFSAFYGDLIYDKLVCERAFAKWVARGYRGPGELSIYIEILAAHLEVPTQQSIFRNLANDCISVVKKNRSKVSKGNFFTRHKFQIMVNLGILVLLIAMFYLGKISGG